jgi:hypothetical protein
MCKKNISVVLAGVMPQQQSEVAEALTAELQKRGTDAVCVITDIGAQASAQEAVQTIIQSLESNGLIPAPSPDDPVYSDGEEEKIRKRLENLGYL